MERPIGSEFEIEIRLRLKVVESKDVNVCQGCCFDGFINCPLGVLGKCGWEREDHKAVVFKQSLQKQNL